MWRDTLRGWRAFSFVYFLLITALTLAELVGDIVGFSDLDTLAEFSGLTSALESQRLFSLSILSTGITIASAARAYGVFKGRRWSIRAGTITGVLLLLYMTYQMLSALFVWNTNNFAALGAGAKYGIFGLTRIWLVRRGECRGEIMRAIIRERRVLPECQSASGLERVDDYFFVIGDDSPDLVRLDTHWNVVGTTRLFDPGVNAGKRIAKTAKPDLEALCCVEWNGRREILCFGSGSRAPERDVCFRVDVTNPAQPLNVRAVQLTALYDSLRRNPEIVGAHKLNLEAAASTDAEILLFQRGNISEINLASHFALDSFMQHLDSPSSPPPVPQVHIYELPKSGIRRAGFSAATTWEDAFVVAATVEDTENEIDDGATLGSFIGLIRAGELRWMTVVEQDDEAAPLKIEGLVVQATTGTGFYLVAVTDDDMGDSEVLEIEVQ